MTNDPVPPSEATTSRVSKKWLVRMLLIAAALLGVGFWGLYDATVAYPRRGREAAEFLEYQYLQALASTAQTARASIEDPAATLKTLRAKHEDAPLQGVELAQHNWLDQLELVGHLEPASASTVIPRTDFRGDTVKDPYERLSTLKERWTSAAGGTKSASPLSAFDLPSQWIIFAVGVGIGVYLLGLIAVAKSKKYRWDPVEKRLTLPGGESLVPSDVEEFDKRKWHRLYVTLKVKPEHPQLGGKPVTLDLMRYEAVEPWVLEMEKVAFPESAAELAAAGAGTEGNPPTPTTGET